jgi:CARDB
MRRTTALLLPTLLILVWAAPARAQDEPPPLAATLAACESGPAADERFAVFTGSMPAMRGTRRMAMRFDLLVRSARERAWRPVRARGFGRWQRSDPGRAGFVYTKRVERLAQAASYRAIVRFRWYGAAGVQRTTVRRTPSCRQPDQRPDLQIDSFAVAPGPDEGSRRYVVGVRNAGRTAAEPFDVGIAGLDGDLLRAVPGLPAGERATVELVGPRCASGDVVAVRLDPRGVVEEADERDNAFRWVCGTPIDSMT